MILKFLRWEEMEVSSSIFEILFSDTQITIQFKTSSLKLKIWNRPNERFISIWIIGVDWKESSPEWEETQYWDWEVIHKKCPTERNSTNSDKKDQVITEMKRNDKTLQIPINHWYCPQKTWQTNYIPVEWQV